MTNKCMVSYFLIKIHLLFHMAFAHFILRYVYLLAGVLAVRQLARCVPVTLSLSEKMSFEGAPNNGFEGANFDIIFLSCSLLNVL